MVFSLSLFSSRKITTAMWIPKRANNQKNETHTHSNIMKSNVFGSTTRIVSNNEIGNRLQINNKPCAHFIDKLRLSTSFESLPSFSPIWFRNLKSARKIFLFVSLSLSFPHSLSLFMSVTIRLSAFSTRIPKKNKNPKALRKNAWSGFLLLFWKK